MNFKNYLKTILTDDQIKKLDKDKVIIIGGEQGPTGKTTLARVLRKKGYTVFESFETVELTVDKPLQNCIPNLADSIS